MHHSCKVVMIAVVSINRVSTAVGDARWPKLRRRTFSPQRPETWMEACGRGSRCLSTATLAIASPLYHASAHSTIRQAAIMAEGMFYNVTAGYIEGIVRGYRNNLLTGQNYGNLTQCETIDGMRAPSPAVLCSVSFSILTMYQT